MNELIKITEKEGNQLVSARGLHEFLESKERFSKWFDKMLEFGFELGNDYTPYQMVHLKNNQEITDYAISINMAKELSMVSRLSKGKEARRYFIKCEKQIEESFNGLSKEIQAIFTLDKKQQELIGRLDKLENTMTIDYAQQEQLHRYARARLIQVLGGKGSPAYKELSKKVFSSLWNRYKQVFHVSSYKNTAKKDFVQAIGYIENWQPSKEMGYMITGANSQVQFNN